MIFAVIKINLKQIYILFSGILLFFVTSCNSPENKVEPEKNTQQTLKENIIQPYYISSFFENPIHAAFFWNQAVLDSLSLKRISIVNQYGDHKEEKMAYLFSSKNRLKTFYRYKYKQAKSAESIIEFKNNNYNLPIQIEYLRWLNLTNQPPVTIVHDSLKTTLIHYKSALSNDSTFFFPNANEPRLIIHKIDDFIQRVEFLEEGNYTQKKVEELTRSIDTSLVSVQHAQLIYTEFLNGLPVKSTEFTSDWKKIEDVKTWNYSKGLLVKYQENLHGNTIHTLELEYDNQNYPIKATFDRKRWDFYFSKK